MTICADSRVGHSNGKVFFDTAGFPLDGGKSPFAGMSTTSVKFCPTQYQARELRPMAYITVRARYPAWRSRLRVAKHLPLDASPREWWLR
jgi:hypothetical protein